ncbi:MAG: molybdenum cofactor biosynthesis protein MoaE [Planctomycetes bacterium]|nr:molybdenum cofactor biosynthesis protein MoaE [Planctomycetota bacterium]
MTCQAALVDAPIDVESLLRAVKSPRAGAVALFLGEVRDHHEGRAVRHLVYEAYRPMAVGMLQAVAAEAGARWPVEGVAVCHRLGRMEIGDTSVAVVVSAAHRAEAFAACRHVIDRIKQDAPIWKKEFFAGGEAWVGAP